MEEKKQPEDKNILEQRISELEENWKRAVADYRNLERRVASEQEFFVKFANANLLQKFFAIFDSLKLAAEHNKDTAPIFEQIKKVLESEGVKMINIKEGEEFNGEIMEAMEGSSGTKVGKVVREGFELDGRVLRPVLVELKE